MNARSACSALVAPHAGAWIEIKLHEMMGHVAMSLPMRERGLKSRLDGWNVIAVRVAPHAGAWIEIRRETRCRMYHAMSLPMRERGLKLERIWSAGDDAASRSPCGSVD